MQEIKTQLKITIDIGHPAHVHYFKTFMILMQKKGHKIFITSRKKEVSQYLLNKYEFNFISRGKGSNNIFGKFLYIIKADFILWKYSKKIRPDIFLSFASPYSAHASWLTRKPNIIMDDTEHANLNHSLYKRISNVILTPDCFLKNLGKKQIRFASYMELTSLHPSYFRTDSGVLYELGLKENDKFIIIRFVSWNANHDIGQSGMSLKEKMKLVQELSKRARVFISSEKTLPAEFVKYQIQISPEKIHSLLDFASLYIGEGATMASECAMLGTPAIYVNSLDAGTLKEQEKYGLLFGFRNSHGVIEKALELLSMPNLKEEFQSRRQKMLADKIDVTAFMVWFIENYPKSVEIMKENPDYQYNFK